MLLGNHRGDEVNMTALTVNLPLEIILFLAFQPMLLGVKLLQPETMSWTMTLVPVWFVIVSFVVAFIIKVIETALSLR
jgi:uncharacterized membrane protein (DUF485 family)